MKEFFPSIKKEKVATLIPYANNSRTHSDEQVAQVAASIKEFGFTNPILLDGEHGVIAGHGRLLAARMLGMDEVPTIELAHLSEAQRKAYIIADNKLALNAGWDEGVLRLELEELQGLDFDISLTGFEDAELAELLDDGNTEPGEGGTGSLAAKFGVPPFSVLSAREGTWQDRKREWLALGIKSEEGRGDNTTGFSDAATNPGGYKSKFGKCLETGIAENYGREAMSGTSIFDPVLCELAYSWFCPAGGTVLDPFAGGSVRGVVASKMGRQYVGGELRAEQVEANREQATAICEDPMPVWVCGDSRNIANACKDVSADFIFSCPPYADLEVYSDDKDDLSTLGYDEFISAYLDIVNKSCSLLKDNSFACFVVGDVRGKDGNYYGFVPDTIRAFEAAGLRFYNEAILVTAVGSLPIRAGKTFKASRKLGKTHQNVLVFVKGDGKKAAQRCGEVEVYMPEVEA